MQGYSKAYLQGTLFDKMALKTEVIKGLFEIKVKSLDEIIKMILDLGLALIFYNLSLRLDLILFILGKWQFILHLKLYSIR